MAQEKKHNGIDLQHEKKNQSKQRSMITSIYLHLTNEYLFHFPKLLFRSTNSYEQIMMMIDVIMMLNTVEMISS